MAERSGGGRGQGAGDVILALRDVRKTFPNGTLALDRVSISFERGEFVSLLGPSGCGKSTILRIVAGLADATSGAVDWPGGRPAEIGFVFQEPTLMPWATAFANVWLPLRLKGVGKADAKARIEEALELVGLAGFAGAYPRELSGGMKMRVSIARALVTRPELLLLDEPFAALDEITRMRLNDDLLKLKAQFGWTVIFVTHSVFESVFLSGRILVMTPRPGRILREIAVDEPGPRTTEFRTSARYGAWSAETSAALMGGIEAAEAQPAGAS